MTIKEWLEKLAASNQSTDEDSRAMQNLLRQRAYPQAVVVVGIVYLEGHGRPIDIHTVAKMILDSVPKPVRVA